MVDGFVYIKKENLCLILLNYPVLSEISGSSAVDKKEEFNSIVGSAFFYACGEL